MNDIILQNFTQNDNKKICVYLHLALFNVSQ